MDANAHYQQGLAIISDPTKFTREGTLEARDKFEEARRIDPEFWRAYAELAYVNVRLAQNGWSADRAQSLQVAEDFAQQALGKHPDGSDAHWSLAIVRWNQGRFDESFIEYGIARELDSTDPDLDVDEAEALIYGGAPGKAIAQIREAMRRRRDFSYWYWWNLGRAYYMARHYQEAIDAVANIPNPPKDVLLVTAASYAQFPNPGAATTAMQEFINYDPDWTRAKSEEFPYRNGDDRDHWLDGLGKAGLP